MYYNFEYRFKILMARSLTAEEIIVFDDVRLCENKSDLSR